MTASSPAPVSLFRKLVGGRVIGWFREHPLAADWLLVTPLLITAVLEIALDNDTTTGPNGTPLRPWDALAVVLLVGSIMPLAWRRRAPRLTLAINIACTVPFLVLNYPDAATGIASLLALYTVAAHCTRRDAAVALGATGAVMVPVLVAGVISSGEQLPLAVLVSNIIIFGTAWLVGDAVRSRRLLVDELRHRAEVAERLREEEARLAVLDERARIAREMHDIVAHGMSVMIVQAGAARRVLASHPEQAAAALEAIETTGRQSMDEMRVLLGVLRAPGPDDLPPTTSSPAAPLDATRRITSSAPAGAAVRPASATAAGTRPASGRPASVAPLTPQPGLAGLDELGAQWRAAGLPVDLRVEGALPELPAGLDVSAYRLVQEALTNTAKHAGPARAEVVIGVVDGSLDLVISDDGRGAGATTTTDRGTATGHGLIGMHERVAAFGGSVTAGPRRGGGFVVHAVLPLDRAAAAVDPTTHPTAPEHVGARTTTAVPATEPPGGASPTAASPSPARTTAEHPTTASPMAASPTAASPIR